MFQNYCLFKIASNVRPTISCYIVDYLERACTGFSLCSAFGCNPRSFRSIKTGRLLPAAVHALHIYIDPGGPDYNPSTVTNRFAYRPPSNCLNAPSNLANWCRFRAKKYPVLLGEFALPGTGPRWRCAQRRAADTSYFVTSSRHRSVRYRILEDHADGRAGRDEGR